MKHRAMCPPQLSNAFPFLKSRIRSRWRHWWRLSQPSKIQSGSSVRFALLSDQPLEFYECWGEAEDGSVKPSVLPKIPALTTSALRWVTITPAAKTVTAQHPSR